MQTLLKLAFSHWQSTLAGALQAIAIAVAAATQAGNLSPKALAACAGLAALTFFKGVVSADASKL